jgi:serine/threonine protein kinase
MRGFHMPENPNSNVRQQISAQANRSNGMAADTHSSAGPEEEVDTLPKIISEVMRRRAGGEIVRNEDVIADHPEAMPLLRDELSALDSIHRAIVARPTQASTSPSVNSITHAPYDEPPSLLGEPDVGMNLHEGVRIHGYCIDREISAGGQATVFKAIQERTARAVAVKIMHGGPHVGFRGRRRFERESSILARLNHPNIVGILDKGRTADGSFYLVMDFIEGQNLDCFFQESDKNAVLIVQTFVKIVKAVDSAHQSGVIHRDLKPMNIIVDNRGEPHILDFGMARLLNNFEDKGEHSQVTLTRTGQMLGSLPWSSPEQLFSSPDRIDARSDVYAIGVMLFAALAGEFPYAVTGELRAVIKQIATGAPPSLVRLGRRNGIVVSSFLEEIVLKALCKSPSGRYQSADLMARDLESVLAGKRKSAKRHVSAMSRAILVVIALIMLCAYSFDASPTINAKLYFINDENMRFVRISAGSNPIGDPPTPPNEIDWLSKPYVGSARSFYMSSTPVTQREYLRVMGRNPSDPSLINLDAPVQCVTWAQASEFCALLSRRERRQYRLPTQAEWKYAFYSGEVHPLTQRNLESEASYAIGGGNRLPVVALKLPDQWGLYDMIGEVRQWCSDQPTPVSTSVNRATAIGESSHVAEGADYLAPKSDYLIPAKLEAKYSSNTSLPTIGFRVVCESVERADPLDVELSR